MNYIFPSKSLQISCFYLFRAVNAFSYYGVVLFTTVLFQSNDVCHGGIDMINGTIIGECKPLVQKDYIDLLSTTMAEFPGNFNLNMSKLQS